MDGDKLDQLLVPEGQASIVDSDPAPAEPPAPGQSDVPPAADLDGGQGDPNADPEEMIPLSQYKELQKGFTKKAMELAQLKRDMGKQPPVQEYPAQPQYIPQQPQSTNPFEAMVQRRVEESIASVMAPYQQQQQDLRIQAKVLELSENKEFGDVAPAFLEILESSPELLDLEGGLDIAYKVAKSDYLERASAAKVQAAVNASRQVTAQKIAATDTTPITRSQAPPPDSQDAEAEAIKQAILGERRRPLF